MRCHDDAMDASNNADQPQLELRSPRPVLLAPLTTVQTLFTVLVQLIIAAALLMLDGSTGAVGLPIRGAMVLVSLLLFDERLRARAAVAVQPMGRVVWPANRE
jgi:hypothetical protein